MGQKIFLGTQGKAYGPYTEEEMQILQSNGNLSHFHWIWDSHSKQWQPLDPAPSPIITEAGISKLDPNTFQEGGSPNPIPSKPSVAAVPQTPPSEPPTPQVTAPPAPPQQELPENVIPIQQAAPKKTSKRAFPQKEYSAICHNQRSAISGTLTQLDSLFGVFVSPQGPSDAHFSPQGIVAINVLDPKSGKTMNLHATLNGIRKHPHGWEYQVHWQEDLKLA